MVRLHTKEDAEQIQTERTKPDPVIPDRPATKEDRLSTHDPPFFFFMISLVGNENVAY